jgi:hypothetical protein
MLPVEEKIHLLTSLGYFIEITRKIIKKGTIKNKVIHRIFYTLLNIIFKYSYHESLKSRGQTS